MPKVALVCVAKNEEAYIHEWIAYNILLGFDHIFIYQNNWSYNIDHPKVTCKEWPGTQQQLNCYNNFIYTFNTQFDWAAFFDVDEFLVLKQHNNIQSFLNDYTDCNAIGINWAVYGNSHNTKADLNIPVIKRFTQRSTEKHKFNEHIKSIVKLPTKSVFINPHHTNHIWYNLDKEPRTGPFNQPIKWNVAQLNHYFCKSTDEFLQKCDRGRADLIKKRNPEEYNDYLNANDIEDTCAIKFIETINNEQTK